MGHVRTASTVDAKLQKLKPITAVVMNMYYTGLGIARSLGERGIPVIGLSADRGVYGSFTRYASTIRTADSQNAPEVLVAELIELAERLGHRAVLFPTRDHDVVFLDRFRAQLESSFRLVMPQHSAVLRCLDKWATYVCANAAGVPTPRTWLIENADDLRHATIQMTFPVVLKPVEAHQWRTGAKWELVGSRKAVSATCPEHLLSEYALVARANPRAIVQQQIPGADDCLVVTACYVDRRGEFQAAFNTQKLVQTPAGLGTGCIVQSVERPELFERTARLLKSMEFTGIAEVEYKWDAASAEYKLIEVNPRPWDQHILGQGCGVDVIHLAYCDHADLAKPIVKPRFAPRKWVAEDAFLMTALRLLWRRETGLGDLVRQARGKKVYAIWSLRDPLPFLSYVAALIPQLVRMFVRVAFPPAKTNAGHETARAFR